MKTLTLTIATLILTIIFSTGTISQHYTKLSDFPEHVKKTKPFQRYEWFHKQRAFPYDTIPYHYASQVGSKEMIKIREIKEKKQTYLDWISKGPSFASYTDFFPAWDTVSGRVRALAVHPTDYLTVYVGAACGGLWKTTDGGESWMEIGYDLPSFSYGAIAIDPNNPETVYAGSGESNSYVSDIFYSGYGMYKSLDGGTTWDTINDFGMFTAFSDIEVSPFDSSVIFASLACGSYNIGFDLPNEGIWKSMDAGETWEKTLDESFAFDIVLHPTNPDTVYACIGGLKTTSGVYISNDQGETWISSSTGLPDPEIIDRLHLDISLSEPNILYAVIYRYSNDISPGENTVAYKSVDGGLSWTQISEGVPLGGYFNGWYDQGWYDLCIAVDPINSDNVLIGNVELHQTTDGQNFAPVRYAGGTNNTHSIAHCDYHQLKYAPSNLNYLYIGCDGGVYVSTDGCSSAMSKNIGLSTLQFYRMGSHPTDPDIMLAGSQDNGTMRTSDGGYSWDVVLNGDGMECFFDYEDPEIAYATMQYGKLYKSFSGGQDFGYTEFTNIGGDWVTPFFIHPTGHDTLYAASSNIHRYPHDTYPVNVWQQITTELSPYPLNSFVQSFVNPKHMIASSFNFFSISNPDVMVVTSYDGGYTWTDVTDNIPGEERWISCVLCDPFDENTMYVVRCGYSEGNKIYKTTDLGETWVNISGDLPDIPCNTMFIDPENANHFYVGTDLGVYFSDNMGESWEFAGDGMPLVPILDFDYVEIEGVRYLRVATHGRGIYETTDLVTTIQNNELLSQGKVIAKPNPFTTSITLEYELQETSMVRLHLYNQLGENVREIFNKKQVKGKHQYVFNGIDLPTGIYFCNIITNKGTQTQKIIKLN